MGYGFHWFPYQNPYLTLPDGTRIDLEVDGGIPYLNMDAAAYMAKTEAAPAVSHSEQLHGTNDDAHLASSNVTVVGDVKIDLGKTNHIDVSNIINQLTMSIVKAMAAPAKSKAKQSATPKTKCQTKANTTITKCPNCKQM